MRRVLILLVVLLPATASAQVPRYGDGTIRTAAGTAFGYAGDNGPATQAALGAPAGLARFSDGTLAIADTANHAIRVVAQDGIIFTDFGDGTPADDCADGATRTAAPTDVVQYRDGYLVVASDRNCVQRLLPGGVRRFAGTADGNSGLSGDGGAARSAQLSNPTAAAVAPDGAVLIADTDNHRIRRVGPDGTITTVAGTTRGFGGDGGPAAAAQLDAPRDVAVALDGSVLVADTGNDRVRRIAPDGTITTVAGGGAAGDGDPARAAALDGPAGVLPLTNGGFLVADTGHDRVRRVTPLGAILTAAGTTGGLAGDGGPARAARLDAPQGLVADPAGGFLVADSANSRIRGLSDAGATPGAVVRRSMNIEPGTGSVQVQTAGGPTTWQPVREPDLIPLGSVVDSTAGQAIIGVQRGTGAQDPARAYDGIFQLTQGAAADPITDATLVAPMACGRRSLHKRKPRKKGKYQRKLWVDAQGKYRIKGRYVSALEKGTRWRVRDACDRSEVYVAEGAVRVRDLRRGRSRLVRGPARVVIARR